MGSGSYGPKDEDKRVTKVKEEVYGEKLDLRHKHDGTLRESFSKVLESNGRGQHDRDSTARKH